MTDFIAQITNPEITLANSAFKILLSLVLGSLVGFERRHKGQTAGMRTFALISMGATIAMIVSIYVCQEYIGLKNGDPGRIAAQVISGIGFLGAGAIIQMKGTVRGLTTAAGIWVTACIGLSIGTGLYLIAIVATAAILFILMFLEDIESLALKGTENKIIRVKVSHIVTDSKPYQEIIKSHKVHVVKEYLRYDYTTSTTILNYMVLCPRDADFMKLFAEIHDLGDILSLTLANEVNN